MNNKFAQGGMSVILYTSQGELESQGASERQDGCQFNDEGEKTINNGPHLLVPRGKSELAPCRCRGRLLIIHMRVKYST